MPTKTILKKFRSTCTTFNFYTILYRVSDSVKNILIVVKWNFVYTSKLVKSVKYSKMMYPQTIQLDGTDSNSLFCLEKKWYTVVRDYVHSLNTLDTK